MEGCSLSGCCFACPAPFAQGARLRAQLRHRLELRRWQQWRPGEHRSTNSQLLEEKKEEASIVCGRNREARASQRRSGSGLKKGQEERPCQLQLSAKMNQHKSLLQQQFRARGWTCELLGTELQLHVLCNGTGVQSELGLGF
ncbi:uncharacterized protein WM294_013314 [Sarcoramphus papa]